MFNKSIGYQAWQRFIYAQIKMKIFIFSIKMESSEQCITVRDLNKQENCLIKLCSMHKDTRCLVLF